MKTLGCPRPSTGAFLYSRMKNIFLYIYGISKKAGHEVHTNYNRTTYENETLRITLKHQQNRVSP